MRSFCLYLSLFLLLSACQPSNSSKPDIIEDEILWDTWGIPHIYAQSDAALFEMMGWSQMHSHGNLILKLYGEARGKSAEYWPDGDLQRDILLHQLEIVDNSRQLLDNLPEQDLALVQSFTKGINDYAQAHPDAIDEKYQKVLPVQAEDIIGHAYRAMYLEFLINGELGSANRWKAGSNAWAINDSKSVSGNSILLANPHLPWFDFWLFYEVHLITNENDLYGVTLVGLPTLGIGFNEHIGWTHTVNTLDNVDLYELNVQDGKYEIDGAFKDFMVDTLKVNSLSETGLSSQTIVQKKSDFGIIIKEEANKSLAIRYPNMEGGVNMFTQWRAMGEAKSVEEFEAALQQNALPLFNVIYADRKGNIGYHFGGSIPRKEGDWDRWDGIVSSSSSKDIWQDYYTASEVPHYQNPETDWIQNANDPPYTSTIPASLDPNKYASHIAPNDMSFRPQRSAILLKESGPLTLESLVELKHDTKSQLAIRLRDDFQNLKSMTEDSLTLQALQVLEEWDGAFESDSEGAVFFVNLIRALGIWDLFAEPWSFEKPLSSPDGFKDPEKVLATIKATASSQIESIGALKVKYGDLFRLKAGAYEFPGNGSFGYLGLFRTMNYSPGEDGKFYSFHGDGYVCATEFGSTITAKAVLAYGNATQAGNPHRGDQLELVSKKQLRDVWLSRAEQEANLEKKESFSPVQ